MTRLTQLIEIDIPLIQAPMAGVSTPRLAAAVSNAGGLGSLGVGTMNAEAARTAIRETRERTKRPFNVNLFCHTPAAPDREREARWLAFLAPVFAQFSTTPPTHLSEMFKSFNEDEAMLEMLVEEHPAVVSFHFGLPPQKHIDRLRGAGIRLIASATNLADAQKVAAAELDAVIAQGVEAGGHRGVFDLDATDEKYSTAVLTRLLVRESNLPVIAAGGIMDGAGIAASLALGAEAVQLGTAFVACPESAADPVYRAVLMSEAANHTIQTTVISGRPARGIANAFTTLGTSTDRPASPAYPLPYDAGRMLHAAAKATGNHSYAAHWAGQGAPLVRPLPAGELVALLWEEVKEVSSLLEFVSQL